MRIVVFSSVLMTVMLAATSARPCDFVPPLHAEWTRALWFENRAAPPGGVWWVRSTGLDLSDAVVVNDASESTPLEDLVVVAGPHSLGILVPATAVPGEHFRIYGGGTTAGDVFVADGEAPGPDTAPPAIAAIRTTSSSDVSLERCTSGLQAYQERAFTDVALTLQLPEGLTADEVLLDVWFLEPGEALPADDAPRALDKFLADDTGLQLTGADVAFRTGFAGAYDVHVRVTDPRTGLASDSVSVRVENAEKAFAGYGPINLGCGASGGDVSGALLPVLVLVGLRCRRRRGRAGSDR